MPVVDCSQCRNAFYKDNGYSDYTVEGTDIGCFHMLHRLWSAEKFEAVKVVCSAFADGQPSKYSVEAKLPTSYQEPNHDQVEKVNEEIINLAESVSELSYEDQDKLFKELTERNIIVDYTLGF